MVNSTKSYRKPETTHNAQPQITPLSRAGDQIAFDFSVPGSGMFDMRIYDLSGREVVTLENRYLNAGTYRYSWDAHALARGCYTVRLQTGAGECLNFAHIIH
jgi:hypothetical protein